MGHSKENLDSPSLSISSHPTASRPLSLSTRLRIIHYLQEHHTTTTVELAQSWGITRADIRYHLNQLLKEKIIEQLPPEPDPLAGPGRPIIRYHLAERNSTNPINQLCQVLLGLLLSPLEASQRPNVVREIAGQMANQISHPSFSPANLTQRLNQAVDDLNQARYHSRWEARAQGPRIVLRSCPYATMLANTPELCQMDQFILETILQMPVKQISRINFETGVPPACVFELR